mgnify:CR=1 FL=1
MINDKHLNNLNFAVVHVGILLVLVLVLAASVFIFEPKYLEDISFLIIIIACFLQLRFLRYQYDTNFCILKEDILSVYNFENFIYVILFYEVNFWKLFSFICGGWIVVLLFIISWFITRIFVHEKN